MSNEEFLKSISEVGEEWRDFTDHDMLFAVSSYGRVIRYEQSIPVNSPNGGCHTRTLKAQILKQAKFNAAQDKRKHGSYLTVTLGFKENRRRIGVHRIVAKMFLENPNNYPHIDHIDGDRTNNHVENLRFCTAKMNMNNPITKERIRESLMGKPSALRIPVVAFKNGEPIKVYPSLLATKDDSFSPNRVQYCCEGLKPNHKGIEWKYLSDCPNLNISDVNVL